MKLYVVYVFDEQIVGVYSDPETANRVAEEYDTMGKASNFVYVIEHELDKEPDYTGCFSPIPTKKQLATLKSWAGRFAVDPSQIARIVR